LRVTVSFAIKADLERVRRYLVVLLLTCCATVTGETWCDATTDAPVPAVECDAARRTVQEPHIRTGNSALALMLDWGSQYSPRLAELIRTIDRSDVVAYVELGASLPHSQAGKMVFISAAGGRRYVFVTLAARRDAMSTLVSLAHELVHVAEVAGDPSIVDSETMLRAYERIGSVREHASRLVAETGEAVAVGSDVARDLKSRAPDLVLLVSSEVKRLRAYAEKASAVSRRGLESISPVDKEFGY
jgi:hypothetical protein